MSNFINETAQKEAVAKQKLEDFIEGLFDRTETAEGRLQEMKRSLAMSQDGLALLSEMGSVPVLDDMGSRHTLPGVRRRQV